MANERSTRAVGFFKNIILTKKGKEMLLSSNNNIDNSIEFNICKFGDGRLLESEIDSATDIKSAWMEQSINTVRIDNSSSVPKLIIEITFSNKDMTEPRVMSELGIFAKDKQSKTHLFAYCLSNVETGEDIEIENDYPTTFKISIISIIDNNTNVTNIIDPDGFLTKEVIELLKESIRNIAFRKIRGTLTDGQSVIQVPQGAELMPISQRATLQIEGEIYFIDRDYTIDVGKNTITLLNPFRFKAGDMYEIIDPLPATYVKEQIQEFIDDFKKLVSDSKIEFSKLVSDSKIEFEKMKDEISLEIDKKLEEVYKEFDEYIEQNKENLKGHSVDMVVENGQDENRGNKYKLIRDDGKDIGEFVAPAGDDGRDGVDGKDGVQGERGLGVVDWVSGDNSTVESPTARLVLEDGSKTPTEIPIPRGPKGEGFKIAETYPSVAEMEADFDTDEVLYGEYVIISSNDDDNAKLFEKTTERFEFIVQMGRNGKSAYESWLSIGNEGTEEDFINFLKPNYVSRLITIQANGDRVYGWFDQEGNQVGEYVTEKGDKGDQGKPGVNWDGTIPEYPDIPTNIPYGTLFELAPGALPIAGWVYANGDTLPKGRYPHLVGVAGFDSRQVPEKSDINIDDMAYTDKRIFEDEVEYWSGESTDSKVLLLKEYRGGTGYRSVKWNYLNSDKVPSSSQTTNGRMVTSDIGTDKENKDFMEVRFDNEYFLHRFSFYKGTDKTTNDKIFIQFKSGDIWTSAVELNPSTDFIPDTDRGVEGEYFYIDLKKYTLSTNNFRIVGYRATSSNMYFCGFRLYAGSEPLEYKEIITLPVAKTTEDRFKIVYVGEPVAESIESMYSYNGRMSLNGEVPIELAINNQLPFYSNGITMSEPQRAKLGYENVYNKELDSWELVKTHRDIEGYYYDIKGELKHLPKPTEWHKWSFVANNWIEDVELKEKAKKELLNSYIELEIKKDKMVQLGLELNDIELEIEAIKKELEKIDGKI
ncbi:MAG: hypothetical protein ACRCX2_12580 [Paraclostridium sp.]